MSGPLESLHRLIEASRAERLRSPMRSTWHGLWTIGGGSRSASSTTVPRPDWTELHRKSALSQGEQKVLCYLPLFSAAAAHLTSVAGAAPFAPRFVLLDDAFPKIDARTHPLAPRCFVWVV